jgi:transposase
MKFPQIIGADLSKKSIDFINHLSQEYLKTENTTRGYLEFISWLNNKKIDCSAVMIVMEHVGLYSKQFEQFLHQKELAFTKVSGLAIKRSMGLVRGKSDKLDAARIARYGYQRLEDLIVTQPVNETLERLKMLHSLRERLVKHRAGLITAVKETRQTCSLKNSDIMIASQLQLIKSFTTQITKIETTMDELIKSQSALKTNYDLLQSVKGVGPVLALATVIKTSNFSCFNNARKFACLCGTAPFEKTSGTSIRGKTRVSHLADKRMKTLLDLAAKSAIQYDKELKEYYIKRTQNGKSKMSTINVVRNKILGRMFAVIKRQTPFIENYLQAA